MHSRYLNIALFAGIIGLACPVEGRADETSFYPELSGEVVIELQNEWATDSDDPNEERNNLFLRTEVAPTLQFTENFYIDGVAVLEPVLDFDPGEDTEFDEEGIFIEEIKLNYEKGPWTAFAGKFNPGFGIGWDFGRGIWSEDFAEDYEITEKIGFGGSYEIDAQENGTHVITASTFFADTSFLSDSIIQERGDLDEADGGASNTEDFSSFVVSIEGENILNVDGLYYKAAIRHLAEGDANTGGDDEQGVALTLGHVVNVTDRVSVDGLVEFVDISNYDGSNDDNQYVYASAVVTIDEVWNVTAGATSRNVDYQTGRDDDDFLFQLSGGYDFQNGLTLEAGWRETEEGNVDTTILGALARYSFEF